MPDTNLILSVLIIAALLVAGSGAAAYFAWRIHANHNRLAETLKKLTQTTDALGRSEERYRNIFDTTSVGIREVDMSKLVLSIQDLHERGISDLGDYLADRPEEIERLLGDVWTVDLNDALVRIYGAADKAQLTGRLKDKFRDHSLAAFTELLLAMWRGDPNFQCETLVRGFDDRDIWILVSIALPTDPERAHRVPYAILDVTNLKAAEKALQASEEKLRHAQKMEAIGHLTGGIAHDFNNLLTAIMSSLDLLERGIADEKLLRFVHSARNASDRGAALTRRLLTFARKQTLVPAATDLNQLVAGMEDILRNAVGRAVEIRMATAEDLWPCEVDPEQVENTILNLAINARDAMPDGGTITLETGNVAAHEAAAVPRIELKNRDHVRLSMRDTGTGIAPGDLDHVFDPFFTTKESGKGSGLGLAMAQSLVGQLDGGIAVTSELGVGTTVTIYFPRGQRAPDPGLAAERPEEKPAATAPDSSILVVEDDPEVRDTTVAVLDELGYRSFCVDNGAAAIEFLERTKDVRLVVADFLLPGHVKGTQLAEQVRARWPRIKVLLMSGHSEQTIEQAGVSCGRLELIQKPFRAFDFARKVASLLSVPTD